MNLNEREMRAKKIVAYLKKIYPKPKSELIYATPFQFVVAVILSAQCTDKKVNECTALLFEKYKTLEKIQYIEDIQSYVNQDGSILWKHSRIC